MSQPNSPQPDNTNLNKKETETNRLPIRTYHCRLCSHLLLATTRDLSKLPRRKSNQADENENTAHSTNANANANITTKNEEGDGTGVGGIDRALILPLPAKSKPKKTKKKKTRTLEDHDGNENAQDDVDEEVERAGEDTDTKGAIDHTTILLSTILPNPSRTLIRRSDGFEKRLFLRCGRCGVVMGYFLDHIHFPETVKKNETGTTGSGEDGDDASASPDEPKVVYILPGSLVETDALADGDEGRLSARDKEWRMWIR